MIAKRLAVPYFQQASLPLGIRHVPRADFMEAIGKLEDDVLIAFQIDTRRVILEWEDPATCEHDPSTGFANTWLALPDLVRRVLLLRALVATCDSNRVRETDRELCPETKTATLCEDGGKGFLKHLFNKLVPPGQQAYKEIKEPTVIHHKAFDQPSSSSGPTGIHRMVIRSRTKFLTIFVWFVVMGVYGVEEDERLIRSNLEGPKLNTEDQQLAGHLQEERIPRCAKCHTVQPKKHLLRCAECKTVGLDVYYCNRYATLRQPVPRIALTRSHRACQVDDWKHGEPPHKATCGEPPSKLINEEPLSEEVMQALDFMDLTRQRRKNRKPVDRSDQSWHLKLLKKTAASMESRKSDRQVAPRIAASNSMTVVPESRRIEATTGSDTH